MMKRISASCILTGCLFLLNSCATYYIPVDSFKQQFADIDPSEFKMVATEGPMGDVVKYKTLPADYIKCLDKNGRAVELRKTPSLEIRFTDSSGKKTTFYFDLISVNGNIVSGSQSRFITAQKTIPLNTIKTIQVQDGKKRFSYVQR